MVDIRKGGLACASGRVRLGLVVRRVREEALMKAVGPHSWADMDDGITCTTERDEGIENKGERKGG